MDIKKLTDFSVGDGSSEFGPEMQNKRKSFSLENGSPN